ncbi:uncharacterized protein [Onthophagus taurus]|uniref:uncharacterized protein n=1 Tax=Onthophagus taurus TaxID=166361 RepID=UPI0039BE0990
MVTINPINVLNLLMTVFTVMNIPQTPVNEAEVSLKENIQRILMESMEDYNMQIEDETVLIFDSSNGINDGQQIIEDQDTTDRFVEDTDAHCPLKDDIDYEYKLEAVNYWTSGKKGYLKLETVKNKYRKVTSKTQLHRWSKYIEERGTYKEKLAEITEFVINQARAAVDNKLPLHDIDIRRWAIQARNEKNLSPQLFKASHSWVQRFKKANRLVSRKITKFLSQKQIGNVDRVKTLAKDFVKEAKLQIQIYGPENTYNSDQSGFNLEFHSGRTLSDLGVKTVESVVQSVSSTTHSYTIQPVISADGKLLSPLFIVLKEPSGSFGPRVANTMFKADNIYVLASKSGKLTSEHMKNWLQNVYFPNTGSKSLLLLDSWSGHCPEVISEITPSEYGKILLEDSLIRLFFTSMMSIYIRGITY